MPEFMELIETIRAEEISVQRIFEKDGVGVRTIGRRNTVEYKRNLAEAARFVGDVYAGKYPVRRLVEALGTSDFPLLFGDILDRQLLGKYQETPAIWPQIARRATVRDFRTVNRFTVDGSEAQLAQVPAQTEYPASNLTEGRYQYAVTKYGRRIPFSWEAMVNDDLDALKDIPERFARAARRTESRFVTELYVDANGPHASFYTGGNGNIVTGNPALSIAGLQTAMTVLGNMLDADGEPIAVETVTLVVPPALRVTAQNIINALTIDVNEAGGTANQRLRAQNWMRSGIAIAVDPYIPLVASSANGATSWFLFAEPSVGRPAIELGFLRGYEQPQVFIKSPNAQRVGGGMADPMDGDFDTDSIQYKVRHVLGGTRMEPKSSVASNGSGS